MPKISLLLKSRIGLIIIGGIIVRMLFIFFFAELFFNRSNIYVDRDTSAWVISFQNLFETGSYSINPEHEFGYFGRMPGYSFFLGFFWLITGNWESIFPLVAFVQIILDTLAIWLIYKISIRIMDNRTIALVTSFLYAFYPFIIVWNPVAYSESLSVFTMILSLYFLLGKDNLSISFSGVFLGLGILLRPQLFLLVPIFAIYIIVVRKRLFSRAVIYFALVIFLTYGIWPIRNYVNHNKIILTQDLRGFNNWDIDVISFLQYIYSVKAEWEPQFSSIINNTETKWPKESYLSKNDSLLLEYAVTLSKTCGCGFSHWSGYWKSIVDENNSCTKEISDIFTYLRNNQKIHNPFNYYVKVPLENLTKAIFKNSLYKKDTSVRKLASSLFYYRTLLIIIGILGIILLAVRKNYYYLIFLTFFILLYATLCWGESPQMRNIEIRYFLHADILLLFPAAYFLISLSKKFHTNK